MPCIRRAAATEILPGVLIGVGDRAPANRKHASHRRHHLLRWRVLPPRGRSGALGVGRGGSILEVLAALASCDSKHTSID